MDTIHKKPPVIPVSEIVRLPKNIAAEKLYDTYAPILYGFALKIVHNEPLAEEILQQSLIYIWKEAHIHPSEVTLLSMINTVRVIATIKLKETSNHKNQPGSIYVDHNENIDNSHDSVMTNDHDRILNLIFLKGHTVNDVATKLSMEVSKVRTLLREAIRQYRNSKMV
jgi:hypothetical protein